MKRQTKAKILGALGLAVAAVTLSGCTNTFCSPLDQANIAYPYEQGVTVYCDRDELPSEYAAEGLSWQAIDGNENVVAYIPFNETGNYVAKKATRINSLVAQCRDNGMPYPSYDYFKALDDKVLDAAIASAVAADETIVISELTADDINPFDIPDSVGNEKDNAANDKSILRKYGYLKFYGDENSMWGNFDKWTNEIRLEIGSGLCPSSGFLVAYKGTINQIVAQQRSCITVNGGTFGHYGDSGSWEAAMESKDWGYAWSRGFLEGLIVYPVAWLVDTIAVGLDPTLSGWGQIWSIVFVTLIVRALVMLLTFKSTMDQQKTQAIQPQLAKLQAKYPNSNTNQAEKQKLAQEQMALYRRNKISPLSMIITMIVQFPVFICVWGALQGSAALSSGSMLGLPLSTPISTAIMNWNGEWWLNVHGFWTALVLFVAMSVLQVFAMLLPQWISKRKLKNMTKTTANPAQDKNAKTMKIVSWVMVIMTIALGFALPAAMGVYWAIGAALSMAQTGITQAVLAKKSKAKRR